MMTLSRRRALLTAGSLALIASPFVATRKAQAHVVPSYLVPFEDEKYGNQVIRVTDPNRPVPGLNMTWGNPAIHHYSIDQPWNADGTLLRLDRGTSARVFLDGNTYKPLFARKLPGDVRWHRTDPAIMVAMPDKGGIGNWNVRTNVIQIIDPLSGYRGLSFQNKGNLSDDGKMVAATGTRISDGKLVTFGYDLAAKKKYPDILQTGWAEVGWTTISPKGTYIVAYNRKTTGSIAQRLVYNTSDGKLIQTWPEYERPGHGDFIVDPVTGDEEMIGRSKSAPDKSKMIKRRLKDGAVTVISNPCFASHTSARNLKKPGWVFGSFSEEALRSGYLAARNEIAALSIDGKQTLRHLAVHNSAPNGYYTEPHGAPSPDGKKAIFDSNWTWPNGPVAAYVAEFTTPL